MRYQSGFVAVAVAFVTAVAPAKAQIASTPPSSAGSTPAWSFAITPYIWLPTISADLRANGPRGSVVDSVIDAPIGDYLTYLNFSAMVGGLARYDHYSIMTDFVYMNASISTSASHLSTVNLGPGPIDIPKSQQLETGTRLATTIWSLAGGYTLLQGDWGNIDAVAGFRVVSMSTRTNYALTADIIGRNGTIALTRGGSLDVNDAYFNVIGGVAGRINIPNSKFHVPFYFDAGGGGLPLTWQAYGGIAYSAATWADVSVGYRYLSFENGRSTGMSNLSLGGAVLAANFRF